MKSDFEVINWSFKDKITVYPVSDVHYGAINHNKDEWFKFCKQLEKEENSYIIINGDMINNNTRNSVASPYDDFCRPREQKKAMVEFLEPLKNRLLCIVSGNHEKRSLKDADDDPLYDIACKLDLEDIYRPNAAFIVLQMGEHKHGKYKTGNRCAYGIAVTHGAGGGIYTGATVNRNERWGNIIDGADCIIVGHTHKGTITRPQKIRFDLNKHVVQMTDYLVVSSVAWQNYGDYALQKMLLPAVSSRPQKLVFDNISKNIEVRW